MSKKCCVKNFYDNYNNDFKEKDFRFKQTKKKGKSS